MRESRRMFLRLLGATPVWAVFAGGGPALSQSSPRVSRIAVLANHIPLAELRKGGASTYPSLRLLVEGLRKRGWEEGKNVQFVWRSAEGRMERHAQLADELVRMPVDVIIAWDEGVNAAASATRTIPIVMGGYSGTVVGRHAKSLARPGGNVTGNALTAAPGAEKMLTLLKEALPRVSRVAMVYFTQDERADSTPQPGPSSPIGKAAAALRLDVLLLTYGDTRSIGALLRSAVRQGVQAVVLDGIGPLYASEASLWPIEEEARQLRLPIMHTSPLAADHGGLMGYGSDDSAAHLRTPDYVDRILRGDKPGDIPIEQPTRVELHVNQKAANAIGLELPCSFLLQAARVIQ